MGRKQSDLFADSRPTEKFDVKATILHMRMAGFLLELEGEEDKPTVEPLARLTAEARALLKLNREAIREELIRERLRPTPYDTRSEEELWEAFLKGKIWVKGLSE